MKYLIIVAAFLFGCKESKRPVSTIQYPRFVHNKCTDKWAIITGFGQGTDGISHYLEVPNENLFVGTIPELPYHLDKFDTILNVKIGFELKFDDSLSAIKFYSGLMDRETDKEIKRRIQKWVQDSEMNRVIDSINCQKDYN